MTLQPPEHSAINITWNELLELPIRTRDTLVEMLNERRDKENDSYKKLQRK